MRDQNRIAKHMDILTKVWEKQPDTRFHQLIHNLQHEFQKDTNAGIKKATFEVDKQMKIDISSPFVVVDLYNVEDDRFFIWLEEKYLKSCKFAWVDKNTCIACGNCSSTAPEIFGYDKDGHAENIYNGDKNTGTVEIPEGMHEDLYYASEGCPTESIKVGDKPKK